MKRLLKMSIKKIVFSMSILSLVFFISCEKDEPVEKEFNPPTISVVSPDIPTEGLEVELGQTVDVVLSLSAEAGLSSLTANGEVIKSYGGTEISDEATYQFSPVEVGNETIELIVVDSKDKSDTVSVLFVVVEPPVPPFYISDLAGESTSSEYVDLESQGWDFRTIWDFTNTSDLTGATATMQFVASQGHAVFAQPNPDATETDKVLKINCFNDGDEGSWGGHYIFGMVDLGENIPTTELEALPQIAFNGTIDIDQDGTDDASIAEITPGYTRVIQVDAYYDDTQNPNLSLNDIKQLQTIYGLDLSKGYQVDLALVNSAKHIEITTGEVQGYYAAYSAWIDEPNKWVTLTFEVASEANQQFLEDGEGPNSENANPATIDEVDGVTFVLSYSHEIWNYWDDLCVPLDSDTNPVYFRNLRIVNVAK